MVGDVDLLLYALQLSVVVGIWKVPLQERAVERFINGYGKPNYKYMYIVQIYPQH